MLPALPQISPKPRTHLFEMVIHLILSVIVDTSGMVILTHGFSNVVCAILRTALRRKKRFTVYLTESRPGGDA